LEKNYYQIVHAIAGRVRVKAAWLETDQAASGNLQRRVESLTYVTSVRINPLAQSMIITYQSDKILAQAAEAQFISAIHAVKPPPPSESVEQKPPNHPPEAADPSTISSPWDEPDPAVNMQKS
jgi:Heavy metal associated domain 2